MNRISFASAVTLTLFGALLSPTRIHALTLYNNSSSQTLARYNPGSPSFVAFDDVVIDSSLVAGSTSILLDSVTVGIRRITAVATTIDVYAASFVQGFLNTSIDLDSASVQQLGSFTLASTSATVLSPLTLNLASPAVVPVRYFGSKAYLAIGLSFSNTSTSNGWRVMNYTTDPAGNAFGCQSGSSATNANGQGPTNLGCFWAYNTSTGIASTYNGYTGNLGAAQYITVTGAPSVPGPLPVLGGLAAFGMSRKLRSRIKASA